MFVIQTEGLDNEDLAAQIDAIRDEEMREGVAAIAFNIMHHKHLR